MFLVGPNNSRVDRPVGRCCQASRFDCFVTRVGCRPKHGKLTLGLGLCGSRRSPRVNWVECILAVGVWRHST